MCRDRPSVIGAACAAVAHSITQTPATGVDRSILPPEMKYVARKRDSRGNRRAAGLPVVNPANARPRRSNTE
jgi:hypothetical protein